MSQSDSDEEIKPEQIYALVVGIEEYGDRELLGELDGPVKNSIEFTQWLISQGVPEEQIMLFLSPLEKNKSLCTSLSYKLASQQNIVDAIYHIQTKSQGNKRFLYVFWGGHGWESIEPTGSGKVRRLFFADCDTNQWENLNFNSFSAAMSCPQNHKGFDRQIYFIDACATLARTAEISKLQANQAIFSMDAARGTPNGQYIIFASGDYIEAKNDNQSGEGIFSRAVLEELKHYASATLFFLNTRMNSFIEALRSRLKQKDMAPAQWIHAWDGSVNITEARQDTEMSNNGSTVEHQDLFVLNVKIEGLEKDLDKLRKDYTVVGDAKREQIDALAIANYEDREMKIGNQIVEVAKQLNELKQLKAQAEFH